MCCAGGTSSARPSSSAWRRTTPGVGIRDAAAPPVGALEPDRQRRPALDDDGVGRQPAELVEEGRAIVGVAERGVDDHAVRVLELFSGQPPELGVGAAVEALGVGRGVRARRRGDAGQPLAHRIGAEVPEPRALRQQRRERRLAARGEPGDDDQPGMASAPREALGEREPPAGIRRAGGCDRRPGRPGRARPSRARARGRPRRTRPARRHRGRRPPRGSSRARCSRRTATRAPRGPSGGRPDRSRRRSRAVPGRTRARRRSRPRARAARARRGGRRGRRGRGRTAARASSSPRRAVKKAFVKRASSATWRANSRSGASSSSVSMFSARACFRAVVA